MGRERMKYELKMIARGCCAVCGDLREPTVTHRMPHGSLRFCPKHLAKNREYVRACRARKRKVVLKVAA